MRPSLRLAPSIGHPIGIPLRSDATRPTTPAAFGAISSVRGLERAHDR